MKQTYMNTQSGSGQAVNWRKTVQTFLAMLTLLAGGQSLLWGAPAPAPTASTWYGGYSTDWNNPTNWTPPWEIPGSIQPVPGATTSVTIPGNGTYFPVLTNSQTIGTLTMNQGGGSVTLNAGTLTVGSGGIVVGGGSTVTINSGASVTSSGAVTAGGTWTVGGTLTGTVSLNSGSSFTVNAGATLNTSTGGINLNSGGGSLNLYGTLNNGANALVVDTSLTVSGGSLTSGAISVPGGGTMTVTNSTVTGGVLTISGGTLTVNSGTTFTATAVTASSGTFTITNSTLTAGSGALTVSGATVTLNSGATLTSGAVSATSGSLTLNNATLNCGAITGGGASITLNSGASVNSTGGGASTISGGSFTVNSGATASFSGGLTSYQNAFTTQAGSTISIAGVIGANSLCNISGGYFTLSGGTETLPTGTFSSLALNGGGTYTLVSGDTVSGNLSIAASTVASLASGVNDTAGSLTLGGAGQANGTWGSTASTATHQNSTYFSGGGEITVTTNTSLKATTTTLGALAAATYGSSVTFTATIAPAPSGGTVQFETNGVAIGSPATVSNAKATLTTSALGAGSYAVSAVYNGATGYSGSTSATATQVVNPAVVTITSGLSVSSKVYNHNNSATLSSNNVVLSGVLVADAANVQLSLNTYLATYAQTGVGTAIPVTVSSLALVGSAAGNYTLTQPTGLTGNITVAPVTITSGVTANNKNYDGTTKAGVSTNGVVLSGVLNDDRLNAVLATNGYTAAFASAAVGNGISVTVSGLTLTGSAAANYSLAQPTGLTANIAALPVTVAAGLTVNSKAYNGATMATINSNNVALSGVLAADAANVKLSTNGYAANFASAAAGNGVAVMVSGLTLTGSAAGNYTLTQPTDLTGNITANVVTITAGVTANNKPYDGTRTATLTANGVVLSGVLAGDAANVSLSLSGYSATFASAGAGNGIAVTITGLTLTGSAAANYTLTQPAGLTANITPVTVSIASGVTANNKAYDGSTTATLTTGTVVFSGVLAADTANVRLSTSGYAANFASASVGNGLAVTVTGLTLTGGAAGNYTLTQPAGLTANITALTVTIASGLTANSKVYDGTTTATLTTGTVGFSGVLAADTANVRLSTSGYAANFASARVASGVAVTVSGLALTGGAAANYTLTQPTGLTANITPAAVTVTSGVTANNKVYNGNTTATISATGVVLNGVLAGDAANVSLSTSGATATFASASVGNGIAVAVSGLTLTGSTAANYTLTQPTGLTANITPATVAITSGVTANNKAYDGTMTATLSTGTVVFSGVLAADTANVHLSTSGYAANFASASVGNGIAVTVSGLTLTGGAAGNYTLTQPAGLTANITALTVTVTSGVTANNKVYDGNRTATLTANGVVLSGVLAGDAANVSLSTSGYTATFATASAGNGIAVTVTGLTLTGSAAANYTLTQPAGLTANITPVTVSIASGVTANNKAYDGSTTATLSTGTLVFSGVLAADSANVHLLTSGYAANFASASVGNSLAVTVSGLTLTGSAAGNYTLTQPSGLTANITPVAVTIASGVTANSKVYDGTTTATLNAGTVVFSGVLAADTANVHLSTTGYAANFASARAANGVAVTVSGLTLTGGAAGNYTLTQPAGLTADITPAAVTITSGVTANSKVYNGNATATLNASGVVLSGVLAGDAANVSLSASGATAAFAGAGAGNGIAVTVSGLTLTGSAAANYTLTQPTGLTANITPATVAITSGVTANNKAYDGATTATLSTGTVVFSGVLAADTANVHLSTSGYAANFASASVGRGIAVTVSGLTLTGSAAGNYTLTQPADLTANITALTVTIASGVTANNKAYDGTKTATLTPNGVVLSGVLAGDAANVSLSTSGYTATFASAGAGNGIAVTVTGLTLTGSAAANYTLTQPAGLTANITPVAVSITSGVTANNKDYNGNTTATLSTGAVVFSGVLAADTANVRLSAGSYAANFASASVGNGIAVTVSGLTLTGSAAGNYTLTQPAGLTANITALTVTIASGMTANSKVYDGTTTATLTSNSVALSGVLAGDAASVSLSTNGYVATFASARVASGVSVTVSGLTLTGGAAGNYTLTQPAGLTADITPVTVTISSGVTANDKAYSGTTTATISSNNVVLSGVLAADTASVRLSTNGYTANFAGAAVGNEIAVTVGGLTLAGGAAGNYTLTQPAGLTANITPLTVTVAAGLTAANKVYDGTTTATLTANNVALGGVLVADAANVALSTNGYTAAFASAAIGDGIAVTVSGLTLTGGAAANYKLTQPAGLTANITQITVAITAPVAGQQFITNSPTVSAAGTTAGNATVAAVWLSTDGVNWTEATPANGWTAWTAAVPAGAGAQALQAYAVDTAGNYSHTNTVAFTIIHTGVLTVQTNGAGTVTPNYNGQTLSIGKSYAMAAKSQPGWIFTNWTSSLPATNYAANLTFTMSSNLVLTANFWYTNPPLLSVLTLTNQEVVVTNGDTVTVKGSAASKVGLADVLLSVDGGAWTNAQTTNGWTNWFGVLPISVGAQVLQAYAVDTYGNHSATNTINFTIAHTGYMTVRTNGYGTVSPDYDNTYLQIGGVYTMQATGRNGWTFTNWTSNFSPGILTNNDHLTFQMVSNLIITANFVDVSQPGLTLPVLPPGQYAETNQTPLVINGTTVSAADNSLVTNVWVSFDSNTWQSASTANHWTNWTISLVPQPGAQSVRAYAVDAVGNSSLTNTFFFTYYEACPLTVTTNVFGAGTVSLSTNGQSLVVGTKYFIKAQPQTGCVFSNWTSNLLPPSTAQTLTFTMVSNLVLTANFLEITHPTLAITNPVKGQVVTTSTLNVQGTAADNVAVSQVWYTVNASGWQPAAGTTSWSASAALSPGTNVIQAYALDTAGNASPTNTVTVLYSVPAVLTLQTNGLGTISNPNTGGFVIGQKYSLTAVAAPGFAFTNWTSNLTPGTNKATITFTMVSNLVLTANFADTLSPTVAITSPATGGRFTNSQITVTGTASDNWGVGAVYCQLNGGAWLPANPTTSGYTNWSLSLNLAAGTNVIKAYAVDLGVQTYGVGRYSTTNSVTVLFLAAPYNLQNLRAVITPDDGTPNFEVDFGSNVFSQYAWGTNNYNAAGTYQYSNPGAASGVLNLQSVAPPQNAYVQNLQLNFTNRYVARFLYNGGGGQFLGATAVFSPATNVATAPLGGQTLESVSALGTIATYNLLTNGQVVQVSGAQRQTNAWTYQNFGPVAGLLTLAKAGQTNWLLIHFESVHAAEYFSENNDNAEDAGLIGFVRPASGGVAPAAGTLAGQDLLVNSGATLTSVALSATQFTLTTSDDSLTGSGSYTYSLPNVNEGRFILNYSAPADYGTVTNEVQFLNPNFGVITNTAGNSGVILR